MGDLIFWQVLIMAVIIVVVGSSPMPGIAKLIIFSVSTLAVIAGPVVYAILQINKASSEEGE